MGAGGWRQTTSCPSTPLSPDGRYATSYGGGFLLDCSDGRKLAALAGTNPPAAGVAFHPHEPIVLRSTDQVRAFEVPSGRELFSLDGHDGDVYCVAFSPDGTRLASGGEDGTIVIWDTATKVPLLKLYGHENYVRTLAWSHDGTRLASGSGDQSIRIWESRSASDRYLETLQWNVRKAEAEQRVRSLLASGSSGAEIARTLDESEAVGGDPEEAAADRIALLGLLQSD